MGGDVELSVDQREMQAVGRAIRAEGDGKALRRDLMVGLRAAVEPGISKVQGKLQSIPHGGATSASPALGSFLASKVKAQVRLSGRSTGVAVRMAKTPQLRGFAMASRRLNRTHWRHPVFGRDVWVDQMSPMPDYFDTTLADDRDLYRAAVIEALERMRARMSARAEI